MYVGHKTLGCRLPAVEVIVDMDRCRHDCFHEACANALSKSTKAATELRKLDYILFRKVYILLLMIFNLLNHLTNLLRGEVTFNAVAPLSHYVSEVYINATPPILMMEGFGYDTPGQHPASAPGCVATCVLFQMIP